MRSTPVLRYLLCLACAAVSGYALPVVAQTPPAQCTSKQRPAKSGHGYAAGSQRADNFVNAADVARNPNKLKKKLDRVLDRLHDHVREVLASDTSEGRRCRVQGVADGF